MIKNLLIGVILLGILTLSGTLGFYGQNIFNCIFGFFLFPYIVYVNKYLVEKNKLFIGAALFLYVIFIFFIVFFVENKSPNFFINSLLVFVLMPLILVYFARKNNFSKHFKLIIIAPYVFSAIAIALFAEDVAKIYYLNMSCTVLSLFSGLLFSEIVNVNYSKNIVVSLFFLMLVLIEVGIVFPNVKILVDNRSFANTNIPVDRLVHRICQKNDSQKISVFEFWSANCSPCYKSLERLLQNSKQMSGELNLNEVKYFLINSGDKLPEKNTKLYYLLEELGRNKQVVIISDSGKFVKDSLHLPFVPTHVVYSHESGDYKVGLFTFENIMFNYNIPEIINSLSK
jgi:hypothetical protein